MTEAQKKAINKYNEENTKFFGIRLNYNTDADLIALLESRTNKQGFIKDLLNDYLRRL